MAFVLFSRIFDSGARWTGRGFLFAVLMLVGGTSFAGDESAGKSLALRWCASCHLVSNEQSTAASASLPSFFDVAKDPSWSEQKLSTFLADPHPKMPNMNLSKSEIDNLAAYITSLAP